MEQKLLDMISALSEGMIKHPGAGAQRVMAVMGALSANGNIPWDRLSKFKVDWVSRTKDDALCPEIEMEFHEGPKYPPSPWAAEDFPGHNKVLIHDGHDDNTHLTEQDSDLTNTVETMCGKRMHAASTTFAHKMPVTCTVCLAKVGV